jgi:hypothetical protein
MIFRLSQKLNTAFLPGLVRLVIPDFWRRRQFEVEGSRPEFRVVLGM